MTTKDKERSVPPKKRLPKLGTPERTEIENRCACTAFLGPNGSRGGHPPDFDEPPDLTEVLSAPTAAERRESQLGKFSELPDSGD